MRKKKFWLFHLKRWANVEFFFFIDKRLSGAKPLISSHKDFMNLWKKTYTDRVTLYPLQELTGLFVKTANKMAGTAKASPSIQLKQILSTLMSAQ